MAERIASCFIDEAGDFGKYEAHSPFYVVSVVVHNQSDHIQKDIDGLESYLSSIGYPHHAIHTAPLIRRNGDYEKIDMEHRRKLFNLIFRLARKIPIVFFTARIKKSECKDSDVLEAKITKAIKSELEKRMDFWHSFDKIIIYYDNGQKPLKRILNILFNSMFSNVEVRQISPCRLQTFSSC